MSDKTLRVPRCEFCGRVLVVHRNLTPGGELFHLDCSTCDKYMEKYG